MLVFESGRCRWCMPAHCLSCLRFPHATQAVPGLPAINALSVVAGVRELQQRLQLQTFKGGGCKPGWQLNWG